MLKILIVEDEQRMREILKDRCEIDNFTVLQASDGEEGLQVAKKEKPCAILLDILMPKMDGETMYKELRKDLWGKTVPVIFVTNLDKPPKGIDVTKDSRMEYFVKVESDLEEIFQKIHELVNQEGEDV